MPGRRRFLALAATATSGSLAGCVSGGLGSGGGSSPTGTGGSDGAPEEDELRTLDVGGSPGGPMPVLPDGEPALLDFWATWCAPCKPQMEELRAVRAAFPDVHMLSITNESETAAVRDFWQEYDGTWAVAQDTDLRTNERFGVNRIPTLLVFDADGTEQWRHVGLAAADSIERQLREAGATPDGSGGA
jgi:thiol-disulfide isomerase/thioredoxin